MDDTVYETTPLRAIPALFGGVAAGTAIIVLALAGLHAAAEQSGASIVIQVLNAAVIMMPLVFMFVFVGTLFAAVPAWWVLHRMGRRGRADAMILGALLCTAGAHLPVFQDNFALPQGEPVAAAVMAAAGALSGLTMWRIAYRAEAPVSKAETRLPSVAAARVDEGGRD